MEEAIMKFPEQLAWEPTVLNADKLYRGKRVIVCGMGGSNLAPGLIKLCRKETDLFMHRDYGLSDYSSEFLEESLIILSSYSGNTEETLDAFDRAYARGLHSAVITTGGALLKRAQEYAVPHVMVPDTHIQPRSALGFSTKALLALMGESALLTELTSLGPELSSDSYRQAGEALAKRLHGFVPVIYTSLRNGPIAYNWKIKCNETGKIPAFCNVFPELNHNEMNGFDTMPATKNLSSRYYFLLIRDDADDPRIIKRMDAFGALVRARSFFVEDIILSGSTVFEKIFSCLILADWTAFYSARAYGNDPQEVPMIEEFKKQLSV